MTPVDPVRAPRTRAAALALARCAVLLLTLFGLGACGAQPTLPAVEPPVQLDNTCVPQCEGSCCGTDGCGGVCPDTCGDSDEVCDLDACACATDPECTPSTCSELGRECGVWPDGCGGFAECGDCSDASVCDDNGVCQEEEEECIPECTGLCCGPDGCGGDCADTCSGPDGFCDLSTCACGDLCDYQLTPTTPFRRLDTRSGEKLQAGSETDLQVADRDGIPGDAEAIVVRFTVVAPEAAGHIKAYDAGATSTDTSVLNYPLSQTTGNTFLMKVGTDNKITVFTSAATHLVVDVFGYTGGSDAFHAQTPHRLVDTRSGPKPAAGSTTCLPVAGVNGVAVDAKAVAVVLTAVAPETDGSMVVYASGTPAPSIQSLSYAAGVNTANGTIVQIGADQQICVDTTAESHFVVDVSGFFELNAAYQAVTPSRRLDVTPAAGSTTCQQLAGVDGIPADAQAVALDVTAIAPAQPGYITVFAQDTQQPVASNLNYVVGQNTTNGVISKVGTNGEVCFYLHASAQLQVDVVGYWPGMESCCAPPTCDTPPFIGCSGTTDLITYDSTGTCTGGSCDYGHSVTTCDYLCENDACVVAPSLPYHDRTVWQDPAYPVSSTVWMNLTALEYITLHYIGADGVDVSDIPQLLRNAQYDYVVNRGYSLGYNSAVDANGEEWEIRGFDYRCAANGNTAVNIPGYAILLPMEHTWSVPSASQIDGVRNVVAAVRSTAMAAGNTDFLEIVGHMDLVPTSCPGGDIYALIQSGAFEP